jgi:hypothetical protein
MPRGNRQGSTTSRSGRSGAHNQPPASNDALLTTPCAGTHVPFAIEASTQTSGTRKQEILSEPHLTAHSAQTERASERRTIPLQTQIYVSPGKPSAEICFRNAHHPASHSCFCRPYLSVEVPCVEFRSSHALRPGRRQRKTGTRAILLLAQFRGADASQAEAPDDAKAFHYSIWNVAEAQGGSLSGSHRQCGSADPCSRNRKHVGVKLFCCVPPHRLPGPVVPWLGPMYIFSRVLRQEI